ncbi:MAG: rod shape-determining protein [Pseudomonadota bacterium]
MFSSVVPIIYVQIAPDKVTIRNVKSGQVFAEIPEVAIGRVPKPTILAVGSNARLAAASQHADLINPFAHPRSMVSDFTVAEQLLKYQIRRALGNSLFTLSPRIVIHPLGSPAGGFTQVERRAFREMAAGAGASEVIVWTGRPLTDQELLSKKFPQGEGQWE